MRTQDRRLAALIILTSVFTAGVAQTPSDSPLPDERAFLENVRKKLKTDQQLLRQYTYTRKLVALRFDKNGKVKRTESRIYEVFPAPEEDHTYQRLISKNGKPLSARELEEQDRKRNKKEAEWKKKLEKETPPERARRLAHEAEEKRKDEQEIDEAFNLYDLRMLGRRQLDGRPVIAISFQPKPNYKAKIDDAKILQKIRGTALLSEEDHELARIDIELLDTFSYGLVLARLDKGARATFERRKINNEIWLPARAHFEGNLRLLVFKGIREDVSAEFSDYKKFTVESSVKFGDVKR